MNESRFVVGAATDVGKLREVNEDAHGYLRASVGEVLVVCDGMGGHASGDVASKLARDAVLGSVLTAAADSDPAAVLTQAAAAAQARVRHASAAGPDRQGMGTTLVCALVQGQRATLANVGDSRAFIVRDGRAQQLSMDHTKGQQLLDGGVISAEQLASHPQKGVLYMALGQMSSEPVPHVVQVQLVEGDYLVLCSDGVYDCMVPDKLAALSSGVNPAYAAANLVRYAVEHDGKDNATVVIGRCLDVDRPVAAPVPLQPRAAPVAQPPAGSAEGSLPQTAGAAGSWRALTPYLLVAAVIGIIVGGIAV
ncbi:MAG: serine/threonine-protein phosphatase, partial [Deltaproteobacteria bacterium]|nr:serine/threonine-protein phosphatase [Deltaproteobacteria bacterium]